jgi:SAM-dependent methyltransferase
MKLSEIVHFRNQLKQLSVAPTQRQVNIELEKISHVAGTQTIKLGEHQQSLQNSLQAINYNFLQYQTTIDTLRQEIDEMISALEKPWFLESYRLYEEEMCSDPTEYILNRRPILDDETLNFYQGRLIKYSGWKFPAMIIRPGLEVFIDSMVACDPLYLIDESHDLLEPAMAKYNEVYQRRLRPYVVNEKQSLPILDKLPNSQFGLVFAYNFFNFRPFEIIRRYLQEAYKKLQPGGVIAMTFNDCDRDKAVMLVEQHFCCYTPGYLILELAKSIGFEPVLIWNDQGPSTWMELKKPGEFVSLRGGQALAKILPKSVAESK